VPSKHVWAIFTFTFYNVVKGYTSKKRAGFDAMELNYHDPFQLVSLMMYRENRLTVSLENTQIEIIRWVRAVNNTTN
jgi:hypothetical protein